jgi:hypothetical protein
MSRFLFSAVLKLLILAFSFPVFAQQWNDVPGQWVGDLFSVSLLGGTGGRLGAVSLIDGSNTIRREIPSLTTVDESDDFPLPSQFRGRSLSSYWHNGGLHTLVWGGGLEKAVDDTLFRRFSFVKWQDDEWHYLGAYKPAGYRALMRAIPCDDDRFIVISSAADLSGEIGTNRRTPFARMSLSGDRKEVRFSAAIDHGQDELRSFMGTDTCFRLAYLSAVVMTDTHATLLHYGTGLYWVFSLEKATLVKAGNIFDFKKVTPEMIAKGGFTGTAQAILCAHPEKDGNILISAQLEEAFTTAVNSRQEIFKLLDTMPPNEWAELYRKYRRESAEQHPQIHWYRIYPENGKLEKLGLAPEGAAIDREGGKNDLWRPMPDGTVRMGAINSLVNVDKTTEATGGEATGNVQHAH